MTDRLAIGVLAVPDLAVDRGEPLRRVAEDQRGFRPPAMRVAVFHAAARQERPDLDQFVDDGCVGVALFAIRLEDQRAAEKRQIGPERAVFQHVIGHRQPVLDADLIVVIAMAGRGMHEPGSRLVSHMITREQRDIEIPLAIGAIGPTQRVRTGQRAKLIRRHIAQPAIHAFIQAGLGEDAFGQGVGHQVSPPDLGPAFLGPSRHLIKPIRDVWAETDRPVLRHGPGRGGPDHHMRAIQIAKRFHPPGGHAVAHHQRIGAGVAQNREGDPDRVALVVVIFNLGFGQGGFLDRRPHHGLGALIERAIHQELLEFLGNHAFGVEIHRQIGVFPLAGDAKALELLALDVDPTLRKVTAFLAELIDRHAVFVLALLAIFLFDLPFDRQAVTVPSRDVARIMAHHLLRPDNHVFQDLVQRVADMEIAIGIGRAVMQREGFAALFFAQTVIDPDFLPFFQPHRLALGQARAHRKLGSGQVQRGFVVEVLIGRFGAHDRRPSSRMSLEISGRCDGSNTLSRRLSS